MIPPHHQTLNTKMLAPIILQAIYLFSSLSYGFSLSITVFGGSGFTGSRVCKQLGEHYCTSCVVGMLNQYLDLNSLGILLCIVEKGASVTSISKSGAIPKWCQDEEVSLCIEPDSVQQLCICTNVLIYSITYSYNAIQIKWTKKVEWKRSDLLAGGDALDQAVGSPDAVVSCVGVVGTDPAKLLAGNGEANVAAFHSAARGGKLQRAVYVSVGSEVDACKENWLPEFFKSVRCIGCAHTVAPVPSILLFALTKRLF